MNIDHDHGWLLSNDSPDPHELARDYHEHMNRWRLIAKNEYPEDGQTIVANDGIKLRLQVWEPVDRANGRYTNWQWKPVNT